MNSAQTPTEEKNSVSPNEAARSEAADADILKQDNLPSAEQEQDGEAEAAALQEDGQGKTLPETVCDLLAEKKNTQLDKLLSQIAADLRLDNPGLRLRAACYLTDTLELLIAHQEWQRMDRLLPAAEQAVAVAVKNDVGIWQLITALSAFAAYQIEMGRYASARKALLLFAAPNALSGASEKIRKQAGQLINDLATRPLMELLLVEHLYDKERGIDAGRLLAVFGNPAAEFLVEPHNLKQSLDKGDVLLKLFSEIGAPGEESLCKLLYRTNDWFMIRNIVRLLGEIGSAACFSDLASFLEHEDIRVKGEVLRAVSRIDAPGKKDLFLKALKSVPKQLAELIVTLLGDIPDSSLVTPLADLLDEAALVKSKASHAIQIAVCQSLGKIGSVKAVPTLKRIIAENANSAEGEANPLPQQLVKAADQAIQLINLGGKHKRSSAEVPTQNNPFAAREAGIIRTAMAGDRAAATAQLYELIEECVQKQDFQHAERLRERFSEINPNAIAEIIQSAELIEYARSGVQTRGYLDVWSNLLHELTSEEFSAIYHELEHRTVEPEEILVQQGERNEELFFVNYGTIRVFYQKNDRRIYIKSLSDGDLAGESFFNTSVWTYSMSALTESRISTLKRSCFVRWKEAYPGLDEKLRNFYNKSNNIQELLRRKGLNRRTYERYSLSRKVEFQITDTPGKLTEQKFSGKLSDVSRGGLSMRFYMVQHKHVRVLLGRRMRITIPVAGTPSALGVQGRVLSIKPIEPNADEHRVHLVFDDPLGQEDLQLILG